MHRQQQSQWRPVDGLEDLLRRDTKGLFILVLPLPEWCSNRVNTVVIEMLLGILTMPMCVTGFLVDCEINGGFLLVRRCILMPK